MGQVGGHGVGQRGGQKGGGQAVLCTAPEQPTASRKRGPALVQTEQAAPHVPALPASEHSAAHALVRHTTAPPTYQEHHVAQRLGVAQQRVHAARLQAARHRGRAHEAELQAGGKQGAGEGRGSREVG